MSLTHNEIGRFRLICPQFLASHCQSSAKLKVYTRLNSKKHLPVVQIPTLTMSLMLSLFLTLFAYGVWNFYRRRREYPSGPFALPIIGNFLQVEISKLKCINTFKDWYCESASEIDTMVSGVWRCLHSLASEAGCRIGKYESNPRGASSKRCECIKY
jgi:hypothetical protein